MYNALGVMALYYGCMPFYWRCILCAVFSYASGPLGLVRFEGLYRESLQEIIPEDSVDVADQTCLPQ